MKKLLLIIATAFFIQTSNAQTFDYFGQTPPGDSAVKFAPGIISLPNRVEYKIAFSPDGKEVYFMTSGGIYYTKRVNNTWTEQVKAPFSGFNYPVFSADGNRLYFNKDDDIWMAERTLVGWSEPQILPAPINSASADGLGTETADSVIYFASNRSGNMDIWCKRPMSDQAENLGSIVNSTSYDCDPCVAPDGSYLIFSSDRPGKYGNQDLYICFNKGNSGCTGPLNMEKSGARINISQYSQVGPSLSPDGKFLFFGRHNETATTFDIYWVSTHILVGLKKAAFAPKLSKQIPTMNIKTDSVINYVIPASTFSCEYSVDSLKYTATSSNGATLPSWLTFNAETRTLSGTPKQAGTDTLQITATNADTMSVSCTFKIKVTSKVGISQLDENKIKISPNPTTGLINISFGSNQFQQAIAEVFNTEGKLILAKTFRDTVNETINLSYFPKGMYVLNLNIDGEIFIEKICLK